MGVIFWDASNSRKILLEKGASEMVLEACSKCHNFDGSVVPLDNFLRADINKAIEGLFSLKILRYHIEILLIPLYIVFLN